MKNIEPEFRWRSACLFISYFFDHYIAISTQKEPCFFSRDSEYQKGFEYYASLFPKVEDDVILMDGSTEYSRCTMFPAVARRIFESTPEAKFVYVMRHPIDRAFSHYVHRWTREVHCGEPFRETFEEFVKHDTICTDDSLYKMQVERYLQYFPIDRFLFLLTEDLDADPVGCVRRILAHVGVEVSESLEISQERANEAGNLREILVQKQLKKQPWIQALRPLIPKGAREWLYRNVLQRTSLYKFREKSLIPQPMLPETRRQLADYYKETVEFAEELVNRKLPHWYS